MRFVFVHGGFYASWCWARTIAELAQLGHDAVAVDLPGHGQRVTEESTLANRREAIVSVLRPGDVLVGHSGGGLDATLAADAATDLVGHIVYLAAALPREERSYPEAMAMRNVEDGEFEADVGQMLGYLHFSDDGAMTFADFEGAWKYFCHDCDEATAAGRTSASARNGSATPRLPRSRFRGSGRRSFPAALSAACRTGRCHAGWRTPWPVGSASSS